jgi:hypothetical protein
MWSVAALQLGLIFHIMRLWKPVGGLATVTEAGAATPRRQGQSFL